MKNTLQIRVGDDAFCLPLLLNVVDLHAQLYELIHLISRNHFKLNTVKFNLFQSDDDCITASNGGFY